MNWNKILFAGLIPLMLALISCEKFEGDQSVPAYIHVDTILLHSNPLLQEGALTHNFTDVWVYVDNQIIGAFELPATIPVLVSGEHRLDLYAGVKFNGISGNRGTHPYMKPYEIENFDFVPDSIIQVNPVVSFSDYTDFLFMEDFEDASHELVSTSNSDTTLNIISHTPPIPLYGAYSGLGYLDADRQVLEVTTFSEEVPGFEIDAGKTPLLLEMDYNTNNLLVVGLFLRGGGTSVTQHPVVVLNPTGGEWRKVYVNFSPSISNNSTDVYYNVYFRADLESTLDTAVLKIDNLKLIQQGTN